MVSLEIGKVCLKIVGREAGKPCVVVKKLKNEKGKEGVFVLVTGPKLMTGVKRRRCNIEHLEPTQYTLEIKEDAGDEEIIEAYKKAGVIAKFNLKLPSAAEMKAEKSKPEKKEEKKEEEPKKEEKQEKKGKEEKKSKKEEDKSKKEKQKKEEKKK
jgi:large subunit ribosomal protein L14e